MEEQELSCWLVKLCDSGAASLTGFRFCLKSSLSKESVFRPWVHSKSSTHANLFPSQAESFLLEDGVSGARGGKSNNIGHLRCALPTDYRSKATSLRRLFSNYFSHRSFFFFLTNCKICRRSKGRIQVVLELPAEKNITCCGFGLAQRQRPVIQQNI